MDLTRVVTVTQSDWVLEEYICGMDDGSVTFVYETDADLFTAVSNMVTTWPCEVVTEAGYRVWRKPVDTVNRS